MRNQFENLLKSSLPKKLQPDKSTSAPAAIAPSSESKTSPKGKAKGKGKAMTAEQKAKIACIFHGMPTGCVHGEKCQYLHEPAPSPS